MSEAELSKAREPKSRLICKIPYTLTHKDDGPPTLERVGVLASMKMRGVTIEDEIAFVPRYPTSTASHVPGWVFRKGIWVRQWEDQYDGFYFWHTKSLLTTNTPPDGLDHHTTVYWWTADTPKPDIPPRQYANQEVDSTEVPFWSICHREVIPTNALSKDGFDVRLVPTVRRRWGS